MENMVTDTSIEMNNEKLNSLFGIGWYERHVEYHLAHHHLCHGFGGVMDAIGCPGAH